MSSECDLVQALGRLVCGFGDLADHHDTTSLVGENADSLALFPSISIIFGVVAESPTGAPRPGLSIPCG